MNIPVAISLFISTLLFLSGCQPSYPKEKITQAVQQLIKKEYNMKGEARLVDTTLYLNVQLPGLVTTEPKVLTSVLKKVEGAVLSVTRVSLSSDANIKFLVVSVQEPSWKLSLRLIQRLDDIKAYLYQRISRSDYEDRLILEINSSGTSVPQGVLDETAGIQPDEFIGRLIVSQINMLSRNNPFLSVMFDNSQLEFNSFAGEELIVKMSSHLSPQVFPLFEEIVIEKSSKLIRKLNAHQLRKIKIIEQDNQQTLSISIPR